MQARRANKVWPKALALLPVAFVVCCVFAPAVLAAANYEPKGMFDSVLDAYSRLSWKWHDNLWYHAVVLFSGLVSFQAAFYYASISVARNSERLEIAEALTVGAVRLIVFAGVGMALLLHSDWWIPGVYDGITWFGRTASGIERPLSPSEISVMGMDVSAKMFEQAGAGGLLGWLQFLNSFTPWIVLGSSAMVNIAYVGIAVQYAITEIAFYISFGISPFFIAFLGFPKLSGITEGFLKFLLYISIKMFILYILIGIAADLPAIMMEMFPDKPEGLAQYYNLITVTGQWIWNASFGEVMQPVGVTRAALQVFFASLSILIVIVAIPIVFARMVSSNLNLNLSSILR